MNAMNWNQWCDERHAKRMAEHRAKFPLREYRWPEDRYEHDVAINPPFAGRHLDPDTYRDVDLWGNYIDPYTGKKLTLWERFKIWWSFFT